MIFAEVKAIYSLDVDLSAFAPISPDHFSVAVRVIVGPRDLDGEESFDIQVCSPSFLATICEKEGFVVGRHYLFMSHYDWPTLKKIITKLVERANGSSWQEVAERVGRLGYWEFEDYAPAIGGV